MVDAAKTTTAVTVDRKAARLAAIEGLRAVKTAAESLGDDENLDAASVLVAVDDAITAFSPRTRASAGPRETLEKAPFDEVGAYFAQTGLSRKDLAAAAGVSTSVIATVQNEKGDRWSAVTFAAKKILIEAWMAAHHDELVARRAAADAEAQAKVAAAAAKAAKQAAPKTATAAKPAASAKAANGKAKRNAAKPGRPSAARRAANRAPQAPVATA